MAEDLSVRRHDTQMNKNPSWTPLLCYPCCLEATKIIRQREKQTNGHIPIIAMTAHAMKGDQEACLDAGMDDYIAKSIEPQQLLDAIQKQILAFLQKWNVFASLQ